jgi:dephospho-CoA kinase
MSNAGHSADGARDERRRLVIGIVGRNGAGKDELARYLARTHEVRALSIGGVVRKVAVWRGLPTTRATLREISSTLKEHRGPDVFIRHVIRQIVRQDWPVVAVSGLRTPGDVESFRERFGDSFVLVHVSVDDPRTRFERLKRRGEPRDPESYEAFQKQERAEEEQFDLEETIGLADLTIRNDGAPADFHRRIEEQLVRKLELDR